MQLKTNLKSTRESQGKSTTFMADVLIVSEEKYSEFEEDASDMTLKQLNIAASALSVSMADLVETETVLGQIKNYFYNHAENRGVNIHVQGIDQEEIRKAYRDLYQAELERIPKLEKLLRENNIQFYF